MGMLRDALPGVAAPLLLAVATLLILRRAWAGALALALAYSAGHAVIANAWPPFPPILTEDWLVYLLVPTVVLGLVERRVRAGHAWRLLPRAGIAFGAAYLLVKPLTLQWSVLETVLWTAGEGLAVLVLWTTLDLAAHRSDTKASDWRPSGGLFLAGFVVLSSASSVALLNSSSAKLAQFAGALAAGLGVCMVYSVWRPGGGFSRALVPVFVPVLAGLCLNGYHYSSLPSPTAWILLLAGCLNGWGGRPLERPGRWPLAMLRLVLVALLASLAVWLTFDGSEELEW